MRWLWIPLLVPLVGCAPQEPLSEGVASATVTATEIASVSSAARPSGEDKCRERIARLRRRPASPGAPGFEAIRAGLLARAKAEPVVFVRTPRLDSQLTPEEEYYIQRLARASAPARELRELYPILRRRPEVARAVLLREGYLYAESNGLGMEMVRATKLHHLFESPEIILERGAKRIHAVRRDGRYVHASGPAEGQPVRLLLFDRVWPSGHPAGPPLHRSLEPAAEASGADRIQIEHLTDDAAVVRLRYGDDWVEAVLGQQGPAFRLECEVVGAARERVRIARKLARRRRRAVTALATTIQVEVAEGLPFDEPRTEEGQQDGNLRPAWRWAYFQGMRRYRFNDDEYPVFDQDGRPRVPQVCIDFIIDTFERTSGTWWLPLGLERQRRVGAFDLQALGIVNRRSVEVFVDFAWAHPEWFDAYDLPSEERIPYYRRDEFFRHLVEHADRYQPGDVVTIHGVREEDDEVHYHSFFVYRSDPVTGMPIWVAANAGRPRIRTFAEEMLSAPRRSIKSRLRPRLEWLEQLVGGGQAQAAVATAAPPRG